MSEKQSDYYTIEDYIAFEEASDIKYEYHNGRIVALSRGSLNHALIGNNIGALLRSEAKDCAVYNSDAAVYIDSSNSIVHPDITMVCGKQIVSEKDKNAVMNPLLVVEVLSKGTMHYDRGDKFRQYRSIPTLKEYILIYQDKPEVETYYKGDNDIWSIGPVIIGLDKTVNIRCLDCTISMEEIYHQVQNLDNPQTKLDL